MVAVVYCCCFCCVVLLLLLFCRLSDRVDFACVNSGVLLLCDIVARQQPLPVTSTLQGGSCISLLSFHFIFFFITSRGLLMFSVPMLS